MLLNVQNSTKSVSFSSLNKLFISAKNGLSKEDKLIELNRGMMAGLDAKIRGVDECREIIIRETLRGNFDFIKGFNQIIGKDMAKKAYNSISKR